MSTTFHFAAPDNALSQLRTLTGSDLLSYVRRLQWSFLQSIILSPDYFDSKNVAQRILEALPSDYDDVFDKVCEQTYEEYLLKIVKFFYCQSDRSNRCTDQIIGDCVRNCTTIINDVNGLESVSRVLDPLFLKESKFAAVRRLAFCLDAIGVSPYGAGMNYSDKNSKKASGCVPSP